MTLFDHPDRVASDDAVAAASAPVDRPGPRSLRNWSVRSKVLAIALLPLVLAGVFGGLRVADAFAEAHRLALAADRAQMIPAITNYMSALGGSLVAASSDGDATGAQKNYDNRRTELQSHLSHTDVSADVRSGVTSMLAGGEQLLQGVQAGKVNLHDEVTGFAPILLTAEDAINGSVRVDNARLRAQTEGLSRAVGARGQMLMQELLLNRGGDMAAAELRVSMMTLAGTEPSTLFGMSEVLGVDSPDAKNLQQQLLIRMGVLADANSVLPNNPVLRESVRTTDQIAARLIAETTNPLIDAVQSRATERRTAAIRDITVVLAAIAVTLLVVWLVARSLIRPLRTLRDSALRVAHTDLEREIARVRAGDEHEPEPLPVYTTEEVGQVAHAVDELHAQALLLAGDEARLRRLVNEMFETMSRRNRSLVDQQLALIDELERDERDEDRLESLFRLDHLATRMRRTGANLLVLAGAQANPEKGPAVSLANVISAAAAEVEGYQRVQTVLAPDAAVAGPAVADVVHLLAELIDNALRCSPPNAPVRVVAGFASDGAVVIEVVDAGLGMTEADLRIANMRLAGGGELGPDNARHMGLFVVSRLAERHGIEVRLFAASAGSRGITAEVYLPAGVLTAAVAAAPEPTPAVEPVAAEPVAAAGADRRAEPTPAAADPVVSLLPRRTPGSSGITAIPTPAEPAPAPAAATPAAPAAPAAPAPARAARRELPQPWWEAEPGPAAAPGEPLREPTSRTDTSAFFAGRARVARGETPAPAVEPAAVEPVVPAPAVEPVVPAAQAAPVVPAVEPAAPPVDLFAAEPLGTGPLPAVGGPDTDMIYQRMLAEALRDPHEISGCADLDPKSVWDRGWTVAAEVENAPITDHTEFGLPVRDPGARLVPGSGGPERPAEQPVTSSDDAHRAAHRALDPDAVRASMSNHFGGVRAGRSHARAVGPDPDQGSD